MLVNHPLILRNLSSKDFDCGTGYFKLPCPLEKCYVSALYINKYAAMEQKEHRPKIPKAGSNDCVENIT